MRTLHGYFSYTHIVKLVFCPENYLILGVINENEFFLVKEYLSMKGVFSVENRILDNVGMSLPSS
jgi:hypothetical protein